MLSKAEGCCRGQMALSIRESLGTAKCMDKGRSATIMAISMSGNGAETVLLALAPTPNRQETDTKASGKQTCTTEKAPKSGATAANTPAISTSGRKQAKATTSWLTVPTTKANGFPTKSTDMASTPGQLLKMPIVSTKENGKTISSMAMAIIQIQRGNIEGNTCWILRRALECICGRMARSMRGIGRKASNMALAVSRT